MSYFCCTTKEFGRVGEAEVEYYGLLAIWEFYVEAVDFAEAVAFVECGVELVPRVVDWESVYSLSYDKCIWTTRNRALGHWQELIIELVPVDWDMTAEEISSSITA